MTAADEGAPDEAAPDSPEQLANALPPTEGERADDDAPGAPEEPAGGDVPESEESGAAPPPDVPDVPDVPPTEEQAAEASVHPSLAQLAAAAGVRVEHLPSGTYLVTGADFPKGGLFVEPGLIRDVLNGAVDGSWREVGGH